MMRRRTPSTIFLKMRKPVRFYFCILIIFNAIHSYVNIILVNLFSLGEYKFCSRSFNFCIKKMVDKAKKID